MVSSRVAENGLPLPDEPVLIREEEAESKRRGFLRRLLRQRLATLSLVFLLLAHLAVFAGPLFWRVDPNATDPLQTLAGSSAVHPLGTDELGRDELSRLLHGGQVTLAVGFLAMLFSLVAGLVVGLVAAYYRGWLDALLMRLTDAMMAIPNFFFALVALTVLGRTPLMVALVIGVSSWMQVARVIYGETLRLKEQEFVEAARALGASDGRVLARHLLPQVAPSLIVSATLGVAWAILTESALSYLGLGIQLPTASWGNMLQNAQQYVWTAPRLAVLPGLAVTLVVLAYNFLGDGLRDALDPRIRR
ncbi:MAG: ABC transporter permease [Clostridia bacterium]|nr:ABC transporter permease [Clostridia bacterium]